MFKNKEKIKKIEPDYLTIVIEIYEQSTRAQQEKEQWIKKNV
jgi:hypothetical protein